MSKSALKVAPALKPRSSRSVPVSPCVFYKLHEGTGTAIADAYGNGPAMALAGTGTPWANKGWVTPNGIDAFISVASSVYLQNLLRQDTAFGSILIGMDFYFDGDATASECLFYAGKQSNLGCFSVNLNGAEQVSIETRGIGATVETTTSFTGYTLASPPNTRRAILVELIQTSTTTIDAVLYVDGVQRVTVSAINLIANGATAPFGASEGDGYTIGARNATSARDRFINSAASNGQYARFFAMRTATYTAGFALAVAQDLYNFQGEKPVFINGK